MWEALDTWERENFLEALIKRIDTVQIQPVYARQERNYCDLESDVIGVKYWASWEDIEIYAFFPTDKMTNGMKPFIRLTSPYNAIVIFTCKDTEKELFGKVEQAFYDRAIWDTAEKMINKMLRG